MFWLLAQITSPTPSPSPSARGGVWSFLPLLFLIGLFYLFVMRPQKRARMHQAMLLSQLAVGDDIETAAGMFGTIKRMNETALWVEFAPGFEVRMSRTSVRRKIPPEVIDSQG